MYKVLLIDDEADNGWNEVIQKVLFPDQIIDSVTEIGEAEKLLKSIKFDLIFLDLRFGEDDHLTWRIESFSGFKILNDYIRNSFLAINFSTPVIVFTASNKIWNIFSMIDHGADSYYIKEHPDTSFDLVFSRNNFIRLKENVPELIKLGINRARIQSLCLEIIRLSKTNILNNNIQTRIKEKLEIGYAHLFNSLNLFIRNKLIHNNDLLSFIVFWSILEEIANDYFDRTDENELDWVLSRDAKIIQTVIDNGHLKTKFSSIKEDVNNFEIIEISYRSSHISLSDQISAILRYQYNWLPNNINNDFLKKLNAFRNDIDFIHSSYDAIRNYSLRQQQNNRHNFEKCIEMLEFLVKILK